MQIEIFQMQEILELQDVSAQNSVDGQTLFSTTDILGRVAASSFVTADASREPMQEILELLSLEVLVSVLGQNISGATTFASTITNVNAAGNPNLNRNTTTLLNFANTFTSGNLYTFNVGGATAVQRGDWWKVELQNDLPPGAILAFRADDTGSGSPNRQWTDDSVIHITGGQLEDEILTVPTAGQGAADNFTVVFVGGNANGPVAAGSIFKIYCPVNSNGATTTRDKCLRMYADIKRKGSGSEPTSTHAGGAVALVNGCCGFDAGGNVNGFNSSNFT